MLSFSILYWDLIKFPYFGDLAQRGGWKEAQSQGDFMENSIVQLLNFRHSIQCGQILPFSTQLVLKLLRRGKLLAQVKNCHKNLKE
jgi:hypothetical protein